ncbi:hypothetical protein TrispH2_006123 [Trichoplax sp. H2]|nr:hypothetical protein TrispH2_006123 [Trichoplax sp. H2]|eukprot:RDD41706.1 hypothetical protein TrispH2_006123 [Trichoplax sp. H2]
MSWSDIPQIWPKNWCHCYVSCLVILSIAQAAISENPKETVNVREAGAVKPCFTSIEDTEVQKRAEKFICPEDYFQCNNLKRVPFYVRCDHKPDCLDGSDEDMCGK